MITWVTVWVLTVQGFDARYEAMSSYNYQLTYATQASCEKQLVKYTRKHPFYRSARCDFQQVPFVINK